MKKCALKSRLYFEYAHKNFYPQIKILEKDLMSRKILVTGGAGYIGSMLCTYLIEEGFNVTVIDKFDFSRDSLNHLRFHNNFDLIEGDITSIKVLKKHIKNKDFIIPLAALVGAPLYDKFPKGQYRLMLIQ